MWCFKAPITIDQSGTSHPREDGKKYATSKGGLFIGNLVIASALARKRVG